MNAIKEKRISDGQIGLLRRPDGSTRVVLGIERQGPIIGHPCLHVQGTVIDFVASPSELRRRGYTVIEAIPEVMRLWNR